MMPTRYYANVKLPFYGWFGAEFATEQEARRFIAGHYRTARRYSRQCLRPSYAGRCYYVKPRLMTALDFHD